MPPQTFFLVSLPTSISPSNNKDDALTTLRSAINPDQGTTFPFAIPDFKVGTLDGLVQQADDLTRLEQASKGVVDKIGDSLRGLLEGDEEKIQQQKVVNDSMYRMVSRSDYGLASSRFCRTRREIPPVLPMEQSQIPRRQAPLRADRHLLQRTRSG